MNPKEPVTPDPSFAVADNAAGVLASFLRPGGFPHAILLEGPPGSGITAFARRIAMAALCLESGEEGPCGKCPACVKSIKGIHPDFLIYESENRGQARSFHVDKVRAIRAQAYISPGESPRKVLLVKDAQTMTEQAQNALLKVLEEPPPSAVFILTCRNRGELLETIRSRVFTVVFDRSGQDCQGEDSGAAESRREEATQFLSHLEKGREAKALAMLQSYERNRSGFLELLEELRALLSHRLLTGSGGALDPPQMLKLCAAVDNAAEAAASNVGGLTLGCALCARMAQILLV